MNIQARLLTILSLAVAAGFASAGDITGTITLKGTPAPEKELPLDPGCGKLHTTKPTTRFYVTGANGGLADVFLTLKGISGKSTGASAPAHVIDQKGCEYAPYVSAVQTGQKIAVKNSDALLHNVHPTPTVSGNKEENKAQLPKGPDLNFTYANAESFLRFKCDVHPWMFAYVSVVDHPYFAVTGKDGKFKIGNVPPGKYTLVATHRKGAPTGVEQAIEVKADGAKADFSIEAK
jgi:plastocyanin